MSVARGPRFCEACYSTTDVDLHHVMPIAAGGADMPMNLVALCGSCHTAIHAMMRDGSCSPICRDDAVAILRARRSPQAVPQESSFTAAPWRRLSTLIGELDVEDTKGRNEIRTAAIGFLFNRNGILQRQSDPLVSVAVWREWLAGHGRGHEEAGGCDA
ncbi:MAG: HNH endonuclease signature motif containing protein [Candidatus Gracilibacteria bacterium]|nr:HNH endonuclease signature motif containing protein [Candidatus Gracilibacteria bacterium]